MGRIICISNQKGGVGKTTTAINLAASLASAERRTLLVDMDPQGNAGSGLGLKRDALHGTVYDALLGGRPASELIHPTELRFLQVIPATPDLTGAEVELVNQERREFRLREALLPLKDKYDYIIIDCPPSLGLLTLNALVTADSVLIPLQCEYYALEGLSQLTHTIDLVKQGLNPALKMEGILLTMFDARANIAHQVVDEVRGYFKDQVFQAVVPRNVRLSECPSFGKPIILYDIKSKGCESYLALGRELMRRENPRPSKRRVA
ncbi:ParA family protein [Corallococcus praedator]|uniref:ParA family protein n=3 Tax=Corallococcus TaxID=83461 RepID=A0A3A8IXD1_9BACT|nr:MULTISPECIES: AAA family ATPase [Corallococcus]MBE4752198.1 ParA family protein [Corallococcus soli]MCY1029968.1 AAA family ATPase [Corallococcus sp. BB11-1]RYZ40981.1 MAG: ParA family protein [Myxococcaceae bacterium]RKG88022.1 ParA family protein [Corallococcus terminator]RKH17529.1 ParA family protein [Corallococcus sp. CA047B]